MTATEIKSWTITCDGCQAVIGDDAGLIYWPSPDQTVQAVKNGQLGWEISRDGTGEDLCPRCVCVRDGHQWGDPITGVVLCNRCNGFKPRVEER